MSKVIEKTYRWAFALSPRGSTTHVILHHAAAFSTSAESIHAFHLSRGWAGIAYHYFVSKSGEIVRGRPENMRGAHTSDWNHCSIGICFEGNFEHETMPEAQKMAGMALLADIKSRFPLIVAALHRDLNPTACPGRNFPFKEIMSGRAETIEEPDEWAKEACKWAVDAGLFVGDGENNFRWRESISRQEAAVLLMRFDKMLA